MQHAAFVRGGETRADAAGELERFVGGSRPMRRSSDARSSPSTYSIDRKCRPSITPMSYTRHTLGCDTCRAIRTSLRNRASAASSLRCVQGDELQRNGLIEHQVERAIHLAHPALAKQAENAKPAGECGSGRKTALFYG